jgi:isoquinoline 1-oxidoreductase
MTTEHEIHPIPITVSRRGFLKLSATGLFVFFTAGDLSLFTGEAEGAELPSDFNAFLRIAEDGRVTCYTGKIEMGQGVVTSLAQMLADELDMAFASVDMVMGDTDLCPYDRGTFGSLTTRIFGPALRRAGAEARAVLLQLAATHLKVPLEKLAVEQGEIYHKDHPEKRVSYGDLTRGKRIEHYVQGNVKTKGPAGFRLMNRPKLRADALEKVTGKAKYAGDIQLPGMLCARILRPPAHGARLLSVDTSEAEKIEGVQVVRDGEMIAVLHEKWDIADKALGTVKATFERPESKVDTESIFDHLVNIAPPGTSIAEGGSIEAGEKRATTLVDSTYLDGYVAHAPMEPHTATVRLEGDRATVWPSSQTPFPARDETARVLGISPAKVHVISPYLGGGFGGKSRNLQVVEAARLAKLTGKPVQVAWSRADEFFHDSFRPAAVVKVRSGVDGEGRITAWDYHVYFAGDRGAEHFYDIANHRTVTHGGLWGVSPDVHPFAVGPWRAPANNTNTFARESQIDMMAVKAGVDPLAFRLMNLGDQRMKRVLEAAAEKFGWQSKPAPSGLGRGIACGIDAGTWVATMAEVGVDRKTGAVTVKRVVCAQDMGLCVNPAGAVLQMEGCITMGLGYALSEEVRFAGGEIFDRNFDTYDIPRFSWLPKIETVIIDNVEAAPQGGGEPAIVTMGGALANAIFDACGARVFRLPMTPERVRQAIEAAS